jgi:hypothetical protein
MYLTAHDGTGSSGEKGGAASRHCRIGRQTQTPFLHLCLPTAPCPALPRPALCISMFARHPLVDPFAVLTTTAPWPSH